MWGNIFLASGVGAVAFALIFAIVSAPTYRTDKEQYSREYYKCINNLPAGPNSTVYNDWDEVIEECRSMAGFLSYKCVSGCK